MCLEDEEYGEKVVFNKISCRGPWGPRHQRLSNIFVASGRKLLTTIKELKWIYLAPHVKISTEMRQNSTSESFLNLK